MTHIIDGSEPAIGIIWAQALAPGSVRWRGTCAGHIVNPAGDVIGGFTEYVNGGGWSISTVPYGGFAYRSEVEIVCVCPNGERTPDHWHDAT